jgi:hypothetical protein
MPLWAQEESIEYKKKLCNPLFCEITLHFSAVQYFSSFSATGLCCTITTKLCITEANESPLEF